MTSNSAPHNKMPVVFIGHGTPMNAIETNKYSLAWQQLGLNLPRPKAILAISAHWYTQGIGVTAMQHPKTIHDFGGFPQALFDFQYPAKGDPELAQQIADLLSPEQVILDQGWGIDHGTWSVLAHVYPKADIPVVQLSIDSRLTGQEHVRLARKLRELREQGVLILGSGNVVHNLYEMNWKADAPDYAWATQFDDSVKEHLFARNIDALADYMRLPGAVMSVPTAEHYLPFIYIAALMTDDDAINILVDGLQGKSISMFSVKMG
ncbi:MAG: 4,5-DOPA dioxygenase extradiol [Acinetobacter sp.]